MCPCAAVRALSCSRRFEHVATPFRHVCRPLVYATAAMLPPRARGLPRQDTHTFPDCMSPAPRRCLGRRLFLFACRVIRPSIAQLRLAHCPFCVAVDCARWLPLPPPLSRCMALRAPLLGDHCLQQLLRQPPWRACTSPQHGRWRHLRTALPASYCCVFVSVFASSLCVTAEPLCCAAPRDVAALGPSLPNAVSYTARTHCTIFACPPARSLAVGLAASVAEVESLRNA